MRGVSLWQRRNFSSAQMMSYEQNTDFIKIDVDGYEINVLRSGKEIINKYKPLIYFELVDPILQNYLNIFLLCRF